MSDPEEIKPLPEEDPSSEGLGLTPESEPTGEAVLEPPFSTAVSRQENPLSPKAELKKHLGAVALPHAATLSTSAALASPAPGRETVSTPLKKEVDPNMSPVAIEVEIDFVLDRKRIPLTALSTLAVGEMITLSGGDFKATLFLQEKAIGEGELVLVDQKPTIQVTKVFDVS